MSSSSDDARVISAVLERYLVTKIVLSLRKRYLNVPVYWYEKLSTLFVDMEIVSDYSYLAVLKHSS